MALSMSQEELLNFAVENGMLDLSQVQDKIIMQKREEILRAHPYKIWEGKDGNWFTYLPDDKNGRILKKRTTEKSIQNVIYDYYHKLEMEPTLEIAFRDWINKKLRYNEITKESYDRYKTDIDRFYAGTDIYDMKIVDISEEDLEEFIRCTIADKELTRKSYSGLRTITMGVFKFWRKSANFSISSFFSDLDFSKNTFHKKIKPKEEQIFNEDEIPMICNFIMNNPTIRRLGILLTFQTGVRVGELSSIKKSDIGDNSIKICRTEVKYKDENGKTKREVRDFPKTEAGNRYVLIQDNVHQIISEIEKLNPDGDYLFEQNGKRVLSNYFGKELASICDKLDIPRRSMHKIRRTYGTTLIDASVDDSLIADQMGHSDISTTRKFYYFSNKNEKSKLEQIKSVKLM